MAIGFKRLRSRLRSASSAEPVPPRGWLIGAAKCVRVQFPQALLDRKIRAGSQGKKGKGMG